MVMKPAAKKPAKRASNGRKPPPEHTRFAPGNNANPLGAGAHNPLPKLFKRMSLVELTDIGHLVFQGNLAELERQFKDKKTSAVKLLVIACVIKGIKSGDTSSMNALFDRFLGKVRDNMHVHHSGNVQSDVVARVVVMLPDNGRSVRVEDAAPKTKEEAS